ncbi:MAG TPA: hypothetical protein VF290_02430 [Pyrinomonadaceae bacterium]
MIILSGAGELITGPTNPPTYDAVSTNGGSVTSHSWSHTVANEANRILLVFEYYWNGSRTISGITYNGVALTKLETQIIAAPGTRTLELWYLLNPATGTNTIAVTGTGSAADKNGIGISLYNAAQTVPTAVKAEQSNTTPAVTITGTTTDLFIDGVGDNDSGQSLTVGANQTQRANFAQGDQRAAASTAPGVASESMNWTLGGGTAWAIIACKVGGAT